MHTGSFKVYSSLVTFHSALKIGWWRVKVRGGSTMVLDLEVLQNLIIQVHEVKAAAPAARLVS